jgi:hypothetical protein
MPTVLKWILGILGVVVVIVCFGAWYGYRALQNFAQAGPSSAVVIGAPAGRVFASIADADSMTEWRSEGLGIRSSRRGVLQVGDTVRTQAREQGMSSGRRSNSTWVVTAVVPDVLLALEVRDDSTGATIFMRRDSLVSLGDSTRVVTTFTAPMLDSLRQRGDSAGRAAGAVFGLTSNAMIVGLRAVSQQELKQLKGHVEGNSPR